VRASLLKSKNWNPSRAVWLQTPRPWRNVETLLTRLRERLDQPLTYERKRQLVELLVGGIRIDTIRSAEKRENVVTVTYSFPSAVETCTDTHACINCTVEKVHRIPVRPRTAA
jgi:hypothetical protein